MKELDLIVEEVSQKINKIQDDISNHYDKIIKTIRRFKVTESDIELFKAIAAFLQVEKTVNKFKVYKVLRTIMQEAETFRNERRRETTQQPQQAPAQTTVAVKYKAVELMCSVLKFPQPLSS